VSKDVTLEDCKKACIETEIVEAFKKAYIEMEVEVGKGALLAHLTVYALVNAMLIVINLLHSPKHLWFIYPLIGWGVGLLMHYLGVRWLEGYLRKRGQQR